MRTELEKFEITSPFPNVQHWQGWGSVKGLFRVDSPRVIQALQVLGIEAPLISTTSTGYAFFDCVDIAAVLLVSGYEVCYDRLGKGGAGQRQWERCVLYPSAMFMLYDSEGGYRSILEELEDCDEAN